MRIKTLSVVLALAFSSAGFAQEYPSRPITFVVPAPAGGALDAVARSFANEMGRQMGQSIVVENKPGGGGILALQNVARATADGYTVLISHSAPLINTPYLYASVPYNVRRDFAFVSELCVGNLVLAASADVPANDVKGLLAWAARHKGKVSYGSYGQGTYAHLVGAYLSRSRQLDMAHIPYKGESPMAQDIAAGAITWGVGTLVALRPYMDSGKIKPLAVMGSTRAKGLPNVPTMTEAGFQDAELAPAGWVGMLAPAKTPPAVLARLEKEARAAARSPAMRTRLETYSLEPVGNSAVEFRRDFEANEPVVAQLIQSSGAKAAD
ncbi:Bug family tripartite tricarboxylate transporter substrate binding protein [Cupriavidus sp. 2TAF22]|uniref:Bug family tripartite tricarboxylate transporter substrate binding protein n=1 Tax=unclassified Cupriavidus TaxID=2640874 RepID=UPI003F92EDCD